jgi:hypothetical protein
MECRIEFDCQVIAGHRTAHHSHCICSPGLFIDAHFDQLASMRIRWSFDGMATAMKPSPWRAELIVVMCTSNAIHRPSAIAIHKRFPRFGKRARSLQCPDTLEAIRHEKAKILNGAHEIAEIEVSEAVGRDSIEMVRHSNGSTQLVNNDEMR